MKNHTEIIPSSLMVTFFCVASGLLSPPTALKDCSVSHARKMSRPQPHEDLAEYVPSPCLQLDSQANGTFNISAHLGNVPAAARVVSAGGGESPSSGVSAGLGLQL